MRMWFNREAADPKPNSISSVNNEDCISASKAYELVMGRGDVHMKLGELDKAESCYRLALESAPRNRNVLVNLSFVLKELHRYPESVELIERALEVAPDDPDANYLRANLHQTAGNLAQAEFHLEKVVMHRPEFELAYRELIVALFRAGRFADATRWCELALERIPNSPELHFYRSNLYKHANSTTAAIASARTALNLRPGLLAARSSLSELLSRGLQENAGPERTQQREQDIAAGYADLGLAYLSSSEFVAARDAFHNALTLAPQIAEHHYNLGTVLRYFEDGSAGVASLDRAIALDPQHVRARWARSLAYAIPFPESPEAAANGRIQIIGGLEEFARWSDGREPRGEQFVGFNSPFYLSYQEQDNRPIFERYGALCARTMRHISDGERAAAPSPATPNPNRIRIGVVSTDIREHSVWFALIKGWLEHLDRKRFDIGIFSLTLSPDRETEWAKLHSDFFVSGPKSVQAWAESIRKLDLTVLIYPAIGLDVLTLQLASLRLAPTQITTWGHPETSGLPTIDLYLSGEGFEPANAQQFYSEKLVPLQNLGNCYQGRVARVVEPDLEALGIDPIRPMLICSGTPFKYQADYDGVLTEIASRIEGSQLIFFRQRPESMSDRLKLRLERAFSAAGLDFVRNVHFIPTQPLPIFHGLLRCANLALDTIGFSGYNTAIQAMESGLPLVTREGRFLRGRLASGILRQLGMAELIAQTENEYIGIAVKLASDSEFQRRVRSEIVQRREILYNDLVSIRHLEEVIEGHVKR